MEVINEWSMIMLRPENWALGSDYFAIIAARIPGYCRTSYNYAESFTVSRSGDFIAVPRFNETVLRKQLPKIKQTDA